MSAGRILGLLIAVGACLWLVRSSGFLRPSAPGAADSTPIEKARAAARSTDSRNVQTEAASRETESSGASDGRIEEQMTPEQVRALLGPPDAVDSDTGADGIARERWTYRQARKTVVFENGVVVGVE